MESANRKVARELRKTSGVSTKSRYREIKSFLKEQSKNLKEVITEDTQYEDFIEYELESQKKLYSKYLKGNNLNFKFPTVEQAVTSATFGSYTDTSNFENYLESIESQFFNIWDSNVREGYMTGLTSQKIVRDVIGKVAGNAQLEEAGAMHTLRNSLQANTRTALQAMANDTKRLIFKQNEDLISGYKWLATLDRRTCLVCGNLDTKVVSKITDFGSQPPMHYNCRCVIIPLIEGYDELDDDSRANSSEGYSYEEWLGRQSESVQKDILGDSRYKLFKNGISIGSFVNDNSKTIEVSTLLDEYSDIFKSEKSKELLDKQPKVSSEIRDVIISDLKSKGALVNFGTDDEFLEYKGAEGLTFVTTDGVQILYHSKLSASGLYEEKIHFEQIQKYGEKYCKQHYHELEIQAKENLLTNADKYNITSFEIPIIKRMLNYHIKQLEKINERLY